MNQEEIDRLKEAIKKMDDHADKLWQEAQGKTQSIHLNLMGLSGGYRNAAGIVKDEFDAELVEDKVNQSNTLPVPQGYITLKSTLDILKANIDDRGHGQMVFSRQRNGGPVQWFFWNEVWQSQGPYESWLKAYWEMYRYGQALDGVDVPSYEQVKPVLNALLGVVNE